jgi:hypothetical protein
LIVERTGVLVPSTLVDTFRLAIRTVALLREDAQSFRVRVVRRYAGDTGGTTGVTTGESAGSGEQAGRSCNA